MSRFKIHQPKGRKRIVLGNDQPLQCELALSSIS